MKSVCSLRLRWPGIRPVKFAFYCFALYMGLTFSRPLFAYNQYCNVSLDQSHVTLGYANQEKSTLDTTASKELAITTSEANFSWLVVDEPDNSLSLSFDTLYTIIDFDSVKPMTNGHLHTWGLSLTGTHNNNGAVIFYNITPVLSVSSNALRNPELINSDSMQLKTKLVYKKSLNQKNSWVYGFMSDNRFGDYRLYPLVGACWQPSDDWLLQLAIPDFSIRKTFSNGINVTLYASPEGNKWHVFSRDKQRNSELSYHTVVTGITAQWVVIPTVKLSLDIEKHSRTEFSLVLDDNSLIEPNASSSMQLRLKGKFLF